MTKKIRAGNKRVRRSKPKTQKRVELVRPKGLSPGEEPQKRQEPEDKPLELANASIVNATPEKGGAYARGATRRTNQETQQRKPTAIILQKIGNANTCTHGRYVFCQEKSH